MFHYDENENETDSGSPDNQVNYYNSKFKIFIVFHYKKNEFGTDYGSPDYQVDFSDFKFKIIIKFYLRRMSMGQMVQKTTRLTFRFLSLEFNFFSIINKNEYGTDYGSPVGAQDYQVNFDNFQFIIIFHHSIFPVLVCGPISQLRFSRSDQLQGVWQILSQGKSQSDFLWLKTTENSD